MAYYNPRLIGGALDVGAIPKAGLAIFLVVLLALGCAGLAVGYVLFGGDVMQDIERATVWIRVDDGDSVGTGTIIREDGYILTSAATVKEGAAQKIEVVLNSGTKKAETVIAQKTKEIGKVGQPTPQGAGENYALIKIDPGSPLPYLPVVEEKARQGTKCFVAGFPVAGNAPPPTVFGPNVKIDTGHIAGIDLGGDGGQLTFNTDIDPYGGMGGGPCTNDRGELIGIAALYMVNVGGRGREEGIYAIMLPTSRFKHVWEPLVKGQ